MKTGNYFSKTLNCNVFLYIHNYNHFYCGCDRCGKLLKTVYSVTPESDGLEYTYGPECVKFLQLTKI